MFDVTTLGLLIRKNSFHQPQGMNVNELAHLKQSATSTHPALPGSLPSGTKIQIVITF
jgi:hypothetical protein